MSEVAASAARVMMVAFHFPPFSGSSGALRTLGFTRYLPEYGWTPSVLTATRAAYERTDGETMDLVPAGTRVRRALALDTRRHLSVGGRYLEAMANPDRWISWVPAAVARGVTGVLRDAADIVWSTYPLATAHVIGCAVARLTGRPWVADFRDPMVEQNARNGEWHPHNEALRRARLAIERMCARHAALIVFCTQGARDIFAERYGADVASRCRIVENGFDEQSFAAAQMLPAATRREGDPLKVLHSGVIYPSPDRDPACLFEALARLRSAGRISAATLRFVLRATANDPAMRERIERFDVGDLVELAPPLPYLQALREMSDVDALMILQGYTSDPAVPAKLYEYLRAGRPLLALVSPTGETARIVRSHGVGEQADIESVEDIERAVMALLVRLGSEPIERGSTNTETFSRRSRARELAAILRQARAGVS